MLKLNVLVCAVALFSATLLAAQTTHTRPTAAQVAEWRVSHLTSMLSLTTQQQTEAKTIFTTEATAASSLRSSLETARNALDAAIETNDTATIATQAAQIGTLTGQETQARATADAALYAILNADQQTRYKEVLSHGPGGRGPGRGGPGFHDGGAGLHGDGPVPPPPGD